MNKRGQFYLVAALVIVLLIAGLATVYNYAIATRQDVTVFDLSKEFDFEASQLLDRGVFNDLSMNEVASQIQNLTEHYSATNPSSDFIVIFGNETYINVTVYTRTESGNAGLSTGGSATSEPIYLQGFSHPVNVSYNPLENLIEIKIKDDETYRFELRPGQTLFIIVKKESASGTTVGSSETPALRRIRPIEGLEPK